MSMSLDYDTIKPELVNVINEVIRNQSDAAQQIDNSLQSMQLYCQQGNATEFVHSQDNYVFVVPCDVVGQGSEAVIEFAVNDIVEDSYYQEYDCDFWECSYDPPYHLVSAKAKSYWGSWFYKSLLLSILLAVGAFFLIENRNNFPFLLGLVLIVASLPFVRIIWLLSLLGYWEFLQFFALFFTKAYTVFLVGFITGILCLGIWVVLKFLGIGRFIGKLFGGSGKVNKKALKEEIKQEIKSESKPKKANK